MGQNGASQYPIIYTRSGDYSFSTLFTRHSIFIAVTCICNCCLQKLSKVYTLSHHSQTIFRNLYFATLPGTYVFYVLIVVQKERIPVNHSGKKLFDTN